MIEMLSYVKSLPIDVIESLAWYTGGNFDKLNSALRNNKKLTNVQSSHLKKIDMAFAGAPRLANSMTVYKGKATKNIYSDKAFVSTTSKMQQAYNFSARNCCILIINVSKGSKVLMLNKVSRHQEESEILLNRNGTLIVTDSFQENGMTFIECVFTDGIVAETQSDIKSAAQTLKKEDDDSVVVNRLFDFFQHDYDPDFTDFDDILATYKRMYPYRRQDKMLINRVLNLLDK